jgi:hypothetical protein
MDGQKTIGALALRRIGEMLRWEYVVHTRLPFRLSSLVGDITRITKEDNYREKAAEALRLAENAPSSSDRARLLKLAEGWVDLADKAHADARRLRRPTILHPLVQKKLGDLPD